MIALDPRLPRFLLAAALGLAVTGVVGGDQAGAAPAPVGLGTATSFAVLAASTVTNTGPTVVSGDLGVSPGTAVVGFGGAPDGTVSNGTIYRAGPVALQAQTDLTTAYNDAAGRSADVTVTADLGGQVLGAGVYRSASTLGLTGRLTLDAQGDADAVFIFQAGSSLTTASASSVVLVNGADACNVFWQIGESATLGTFSTFVGTIMAQASITATTGVTVSGRLLARTGAVTLDSNTVTRPSCAAPVTTTTTSTTTTTTSTTTTTVAATTTTVPPTTTTTSTPATVPVVATTLPPGGSGTGGTTGPSGASTATSRPQTVRITSQTGKRGDDSTSTSTGTGVPDLAVTGPRYVLTLSMAGLLALCAGALLVLESTTPVLTAPRNRRAKMRRRRP